MHKLTRVLTPILLVAVCLTAACSAQAPLGPQADLSSQAPCDSVCPNAQ